MSRGFGWWGTPPLAVGAAGLLLLAFGAKGMRSSDEINDQARETAAKFEYALKRERNDDDRQEILDEAAGVLKQAGKPTDGLLALRVEGKPDPGRLRDLIADALSDHRDLAGVIASRLPFYGGLLLAAAAGVLLYRRTPESNRGAW